MIAGAKPMLAGKWCAIVIIRRGGPLRPEVFERKNIETEAQAKAWCVDDFRRRMRNIIAGFEWKVAQDAAGFTGGNGTITYVVGPQ